jgi:hypothetical protein
MAGGFLITVSYTDNAIAKQVIYGCPPGIFANATAALAAAQAAAVAYRTALGETPVGVSVAVTGSI